MDLARVTINAKKLSTIVNLPISFNDKDVEVIVREIPQTSVVDELYGIASNVKMSEDDIRRERLKKNEAVY